jgi:hypothetical protein
MKKKKIDFYKKYREETQKKLDLWKELIIVRQTLVAELKRINNFLETYDTFNDKKVLTRQKNNVILK